MKLWIARDKDGELYLFTAKPNKIKKIWATENCEKDCVRIDSALFPEVQWWDAEPTKVELKIVKDEAT